MIQFCIPLGLSAGSHLVHLCAAQRKSAPSPNCLLYVSWEVNNSSIEILTILLTSGPGALILCVLLSRAVSASGVPAQAKEL